MFTHHIDTYHRRYAFRKLLSSPNDFYAGMIVDSKYFTWASHRDLTMTVISIALMLGINGMMTTFILSAPSSPMWFRVLSAACTAYLVMIVLRSMTAGMRRWVRDSAAGMGYVIGTTRDADDEVAYQWPEYCLPGYFYRTTTGPAISII